MEKFKIISDSGLYTSSGSSNNNKDAQIENSNYNLLGNTLHSDMKIYVEKDDITIPAHRMIIGTASAVLETLVYGGNSLSGQITLTVKDFSADDFVEVLRFLYRRNVELSTKNVVRIHLIASFYDLKVLEKHCMEFVKFEPEKLICIDMCNEAIEIKNESMQKMCLELVIKQYFEYGTFELHNIIDLHPLALDELMEVNTSWRYHWPMTLFNALLKWAEDKQPAVFKDLKAFRELVSGRLECIRFSLMSSEDFGQCMELVPSGFFTADEIAITMMRINHPDDQPDEDERITFPFYKRSYVRVYKYSAPRVFMENYSSISTERYNDLHEFDYSDPYNDF